MAECPSSIEELQDLEKLIPLCRVTLYNQAKARIETGAARSVSDAARQLAEETGKSISGIRNAINRESENRTDSLSQLSGTDKHRPFASSKRQDDVDDLLDDWDEPKINFVDTSPVSSELVTELEQTKKPHVLNNSGNNEWYTPAYIIDSARKAMGSIDCDPASCSFANKTVKAKVFYDIESDGLNSKWNGNVWLNPPYSAGLIKLFADAVVDKYMRCEITSACVLVNNATETNWFRTMAIKADAICFLSGRVKYYNENPDTINTPLQGQAVIYFGKDIESFKKSFCEIGLIFKNA